MVKTENKEACIRKTDMLDWFDQDIETKVIAFYVEEFGKREGWQFIKKVEQCSKPVIILKAGKSKKGQCQTSLYR